MTARTAKRNSRAAEPSGRLAEQGIQLDMEQLQLISQAASRSPEFGLAIGGYIKGRRLEGKYALVVRQAELVRVEDAPPG